MQQRPVLTVLAALLLSAMGAAQATLEEARQEIVRRTAQELDALAGWCQSQRLYADRDLVYSSLIGIEPDHEQARRFLRYRKTKGGWTRGRYLVPSNYAPENAGHFKDRFGTIGARWKADILALGERYDLSEAERRGLWDDVVLCAPDDTEARHRRGEVRDPLASFTSPQRWVLAETMRAREHREVFPETLATTPCDRTFTESNGEPDSPVEWKHRLEALHGTLLATCDADEANRILRAVEESASLFEACFAEAPGLPQSFTIYVLDCTRVRRRFLAKHPRVGESLRGAHGLPSTWLDDRSALALLSTEPEERQRQAVHQTVHAMLHHSFGLGTDHGWLISGFAARLCELILSDPPNSEKGVSRRKRERSSTENLWNLAREAAVRDELPSIQESLQSSNAEHGTGARYLGYAFARYILEAHEEEAARFLDDMGHGGMSFRACLESVLATDPATLDTRLARWLEEMGTEPRDA